MSLININEFEFIIDSVNSDILDLEKKIKKSKRIYNILKITSITCMSISSVSGLLTIILVATGIASFSAIISGSFALTSSIINTLLAKYIIASNEKILSYNNKLILLLKCKKKISLLMRKYEKNNLTLDEKRKIEDEINNTYYNLEIERSRIDIKKYSEIQSEPIQSRKTSIIPTNELYNKQ